MAPGWGTDTAPARDTWPDGGADSHGGDSRGDGASPVPSTAPAMENSCGERIPGQGVTRIQPEGPVPPPARTAGRWSRPPQTKAEPVGVQTPDRAVGVPTGPPTAAAGPQACAEGTQSCPGDTRSGGLCTEAGLGIPPQFCSIPSSTPDVPGRLGSPLSKQFGTGMVTAAPPTPSIYDDINN